VTRRASDLAVSIAHKRGIAVALLGRDGRAPGIDVERVEPRDAAFERTAFADEERALLDTLAPVGASGAELRHEWIARFWAAKEALSKARGTGLGGAPGRFPIERVDGERIVVDGRSVDTLREDEWVLAWTFEEGGVHRFAQDPPFVDLPIEMAGEPRRDAGGAGTGRRQAGGGSSKSRLGR